MSMWWYDYEEYKPPFDPDLLRCNRCGDVFLSNELFLDYTTHEWACRNWPACKGMGEDIGLADLASPECSRGGETC